jgi:hypothetical protein
MEVIHKVLALYYYPLGGKWPFGLSPLASAEKPTAGHP